MAKALAAAVGVSPKELAAIRHDRPHQFSWRENRQGRDEFVMVDFDVQREGALWILRFGLSRRVF